MHGLELVVVLGLAVLLGSVLADRIRVAAPVVLLVVGVLLGFVSALRAVRLPPELVLLLFLPALLYWESLTTSLREIRRNLRGVVLTSTVLVIATAAGAAAVAHAFGMAWGPAWVLGAAVAPTDATAVAALAGALPRRNITLLRAESLVNDGTALVVFGIAVDITAGHARFSIGHVSWLVVLSYGGGAAAGALTAWLATQARRRLPDATLDNVVSILTPFVAYLAAELIGASGVLAAVVAGLAMSQAGPRIGSAAGRQQSTAFWTISTFLLNATLFVLVGVQTQRAVRGLSHDALLRGMLIVLAVTGVLIAVRFAFLFTAAYTIRALDRRPSQRARRVSNRARTVSGLSGFRGAVSLAVALSIPATVASGHGFPDRDLIIFVTVGVIAATLLQALVLPRVVRWAQLPADSVTDERHMAAVTALREARDAIAETARDLDTDSDLVRRVEREYDEHLAVAAEHDTGEGQARTRDGQYTQLHLALIARKRATTVRLRDANDINDTVLRQMQTTLDLEELGLTRRAERNQEA